MDRDSRLIQATRIATRTLAKGRNLDRVLKEALNICVQAVGAEGGTIYLHDTSRKKLVFAHVLPVEVDARLRGRDIDDDFGMAGEAFRTRQVISRVLSRSPDDVQTAFEIATGVRVRSMMAAPLQMEEEEPVGVVQIINKINETFDATDCAVLDIVASVAAMAFHNAKLSDDSVRASTLLGMGKVGHDIGNLAAAVSANAKFMRQALESCKRELSPVKLPGKARGVFDELMSAEHDLEVSADDIIRYSRLISDLSSGRSLRPTMKRGDICKTIRRAAEFLEAEAKHFGICMNFELDASVGNVCFDELFVNRIVQNLVGNAIRAVVDSNDGDGGNAIRKEISVRCRRRGDTVQIEVEDTGKGLPQPAIEAILAGTARSWWNTQSGSGWGLRIVLELTTAMHGTVEIESVVGKGALFRTVIATHSASKDLSGLP